MNVDNALQIEMKKMDQFEGGWPESFNETIRKSTNRKSMRVGDKDCPE